MKNLILFIVTIACSINIGKAQEDYDITIQVDGIKNDIAILAYYYSESKFIQDTIQFNENGVGKITSDEEIPTGIYLMAFPKLKLSYFEFILGEEKSFSMQTDTVDLVKNMVVKGSKENELFYNNLNYMLEASKISSSIRAKIDSVEKNSSEYDQLNAELVVLDKDIKAYRSNIIDKNPNTFYSKVLKLMKDVEIPENPNPADSSFAYRHYQNHYFDNIDLTDSRLIRTPVLWGKINRFLEYYTLPVPDSIIMVTDMILEASKPNYDMFQFMLQNIFNKYAKSKIMSHELVYVHLADKYYRDTVLVDWIDAESRAKILDQVRRKTPTLLGSVAPEIVIKDLKGDTRRLHTIASNNDYTVLVFWNSGCGHCKTEMPKLSELYKEELKPLADIEVFAITTELEYEDWTEFINENELIQEGWIHAIDIYGSNMFRKQYDVVSTPIIIILDRDKKILAKRLNLEDIAGLIEFDMKKKK